MWESDDEVIKSTYSRGSTVYLREDHLNWFKIQVDHQIRYQVYTPDEVVILATSNLTML